MDVLAALRAAPGAGPALDALAGEPAVHVVGGAVRDALLRQEPRELDFVVEGDARPVARRAAERLGGEVLVHERFGTVIVRAPGVTFDVASARTETYPAPGALPEVRPGATLREDLARRDFTVNAMAVRLADGARTAWPGAQEDLAARVLRVLHRASFRDDPTRLLRLARYGARLGFVPDPDTDALAEEAVAGGAVGTVSGGRLGAELRLLLRERQPPALVALERHGLAAAVVHPAVCVPAEVVAGAQRLCPPDTRRDLVALAACCVGVPRRELGPALDRLEFPAGERAIVAAAAESAASVADALGEEAGDDARLWRVLRRARPETVALAGALRPDAAPAARRWLDDVRHRRLAVTGDDFVAAGLAGPAVGDALEAAQLAALAGKASGRDEQLAAGLAAVRP